MTAPAESLAAKKAHVKRAGQTRKHHCHWPTCNKQVPPAMWGCKTHWFMLPGWLRVKVWETYRAGQEEGQAPVSRAYLDVAAEVAEWIKENYGPASR